MLLNDNKHIDDERVFLIEILNDAEIVGIGQAVRGAIQVKGLLQTQNSICQVLISELDFRVIAIEDSCHLGEKLNNYVNGKDEELAKIMEEIWRPWQTEAFKELIEWVRIYNQSNPQKKVTIIGIDTEPELPDEVFAKNITNFYTKKKKKIIYLGGLAHVTKGLAFRNPFRQLPLSKDNKSISAGFLLAQNFSKHYFAIGLTVGTVSNITQNPSNDFIEATLLTAQQGTLWINLRDSQSKERYPFLYHSQFKLRCIGPKYEPEKDATYYISGDSLHDNFDALVFKPFDTEETKYP